MASIKFNSLFVAAAALLLLAVAVQATTPTVNPLCKTSKYKELCTKMVYGATNKHDATKNAIKNTLALVKRINVLEPQLKAALAKATPALQKEIVDICQKEVNKRIADLESSLVLIEKNETKSIIDKLSEDSLVSNCFIKLRDEKDSGFDSAGKYYKKFGLVKPKYITVLLLLHKKE